MDQTRKIKIEWSIKGYHLFHIRPHTEIELKVEPEENNRFDRHAMKVTMPSIQEIPSALIGEELQHTRDGRVLTVRDIAGRQIGSVPANLCRAFYTILTRQFATKISCKYTGTVGILSHRQFIKDIDKLCNMGDLIDLVEELNWSVFIIFSYAKLL